VRQRPVRILLAEDNPADVFLFRLALTDYPVPTDLTVLEDGAAVLELLLRDSGFDILILDLNLPRVGGEEVLWKLNARGGTRSAIPVVVFSSVRVRAGDAPGAAACVVKPEGLDDYLKAVRSICDTWLLPMVTP
jgi:CheY-like chemotaxis protein